MTEASGGGAGGRDRCTKRHPHQGLTKAFALWTLPLYSCALCIIAAGTYCDSTLVTAYTPYCTRYSCDLHQCQ